MRDFILNDKLETIINIVVKHTGVSRERISDEGRKKEVARARHIICYFGRTYLFNTMSLSDIGSHIREDYNHATVLYGSSRIRDLIHIYPEERKYIKPIIKDVEGYLDQVKLEEKALVKESLSKKAPLSFFVQKTINNLNKKNNSLFLMEISSMFRRHFTCILSSIEKNDVVNALDSLIEPGYYAINCADFTYNEGYGVFFDKKLNTKMTIKITNIKAY